MGVFSMASTRNGYSAGDEPVPGYRLVAYLGAGAFGEVWRAMAPGGAPAALKIVDLGTREGQKEFRALRVIKQLQHPNLVPISAYWLKDADGLFLDPHDMEEVADTTGATSTSKLTETIAVPRYRPPLELFIAMGLGQKSLLQRLAECQEAGEKGIPPDELLRYMEDAASALDHLGNPTSEHGTALGGVHHGDIKPQNMLVVGGRVQICDFGLARVLTDLRKTGVAGSPVYMSPEVIKQGTLSSASDQYSLAVSYFELRTGQIPFAQASSHFQIWQAHLDGALDITLLPPAEREVIQRATARDPAQRFGSSSEMVAALRKAVANEASPAVVAPAEPPSRSKSFSVVTTAAGLLIVMSFLTWRLLSKPTLQVKPIQIRAGESDVFQVQVLGGKSRSPINLAWLDRPEGVDLDGSPILPGEVAAQIKIVVAPTVPEQTKTFHVRASAPDLGTIEQAVELKVLPVNAWRPNGDFTVIMSPDPKRFNDRYYFKQIDYRGHDLQVPFLLVESYDPPDFYMMQDKVSNEVFSRFAEENPEMAAHWLQTRRDEDARLPVMKVSWDEARACAKWLGGDLPTLEQWDKAAGRFESGEQEREGPYRGQWTGKKLLDIAVGPLEAPREIGAARDDVSVFGCHDMSGNGREWTRTIGEDDYVDLRGQNFALERPLTFKALDEKAEQPGAQERDLARSDIGFRVVIDRLREKHPNHLDPEP
jgi:serine/threonine protein kinase